MDYEFRKIADGYLYNLWNGKIKEYKGEIIHKDECKDYYVFIISREVTYFIVKDENDRIIKKLCCSSVEGEICNKGVWLRESDILQAARILIEYEEVQIEKLQMQISNHQDMIRNIRKQLMES